MKPYDPRIKKKTETKTYTCSYCDQTFPNLAVLLQHEEKHESEDDGGRDQKRNIPYRD